MSSLFCPAIDNFDEDTRSSHRPARVSSPQPFGSAGSAVFLAIILFLGGMTVAIATGQLDAVPPQQEKR